MGVNFRTLYKSLINDISFEVGSKLAASHWQEGYGNGKFRWDPLSGQDNGNRKNFPGQTRYFITKDGQP
jgi:hypothetical protein